MPAKRGKGCVEAEMKKWKEGNLHSGVGKGGKEGPVVKNQKQAIAIALSVCGKSNYAEHLQSLGFSEESAKKAAGLLFKMPDWDNQFEKGDTNSQIPREGKKTIAQSLPDMDIDDRPGRQKGDQGKQKHQSSLSISPVALPRGNPQQGPRSRSDLTGLAAFEEQRGDLTGECNQKEKRERSQQQRSPEQQQADQQRSSEMAGQEVAPNADKQAAAQKAAETRKRCKETGGGGTSKTSTTNASGAGSGAGGGASPSSGSSGAGSGAGSGASGGAAR